MTKHTDAPVWSKSRTKFEAQRGRFPHGAPNAAQDFTCGHCRFPVTTLRRLAGVLNRNHCPFCLWSRHLDLYRPGDRLSACKAPMRPVGLTLKQARKRYGREDQGELMLIHICTDCGKVSINRIAADDDSEQILAIFESSFRLDGALQARLDQGGIKALTRADAPLVQARLLGQASWL